MTNPHTTRHSSRRLQGGLIFTKATTPPVREYPTSSLLNIRLIQHQGLSAKVIVKTGEEVLEGQPLTDSDLLTQVPVHASRSGTVIAISQTHITIQTTPADKANKTRKLYPSLTREQLTRIVHQNGIVGLGGAGFPTARKIAQSGDKATTLLINAAECDPLIHCDDALMCNNAHDIVAGINIIAESCQAIRILIGIEDNKQAAIKSLTAALADTVLNADIITVPSVYPSGAEKLLLELCGYDSLSHSPLAEQGILCLNISTCYAVHNAVMHAKPLISRITTVVDIDGNIHNFNLPIGTPISDIYKTVHGTRDLPGYDSIDIHVGGKMMGKPAAYTESTEKTTNCIAFTRSVKETKQPIACIRCGACADVCPEHLLPQQLYNFALNFNATALNRYQLSRCIECSCCDIVCPSHLPLTQYFKDAKERTVEQTLASQQAEIARQRFEKREQRLAASTAHQPRRSVVKHKNTNSTTAGKADRAAPEDNKKALIEAALKRKRNKSRSGDQGTPK